MNRFVSIVIPVHNESENIKKLIHRIKKSLDGTHLPFEIIVVNDASQDNTLDILREMLVDVSSLRVLSHKQNCGQSTAIYTGVIAANGNIIVTLDGDGQNDPFDIPRLVYLLEKNECGNLQMVAGFREKRKDTGWVRLSSKIANRIRVFSLKDNTPDTGCGLKVFYRDTFLKFPYFDHMHRFLPALVKRQGGEVISHKVNHMDREHGISHYGTWDRLKVGVVDLFGVLWLLKRVKLAETCEHNKHEYK